MRVIFSNPAEKNLQIHIDDRKYNYEDNKISRIFKKNVYTIYLLFDRKESIFFLIYGAINLRYLFDHYFYSPVAAKMIFLAKE